MIVTKGNFFDQDCDAILLPVSGWVDEKLHGVLIESPSVNAGKRWKPLATTLGDKILRSGSITQLLTWDADKEGIFLAHGTKMDYRIVAFPTRPGRIYPESDGWDGVLAGHRDNKLQIVPGWMCKSNLKIIQFSTEELVELTSKQGWGKVCLTKFAPDLIWDDVRAILDKLLDTRFVLVEK